MRPTNYSPLLLAKKVNANILQERGINEPVLFINVQTGNYTLGTAPADVGGLVSYNSGSAGTFTVPTAVSAGNGAMFFIDSIGAGVLTLARSSADTFKSGNSTALTALNLSQGDAGFIVSDGVSLWRWFGARHYDSGQQTITSGATLSLTHGLGVQPHAVDIWLHNISTEGGFGVGQEVPTSPVQSNTTPTVGGVAYAVSSTTISVSYATSANIFAIPNLSTGAPFNLTNTKWTMIWRAWVYD